MAVQIQVRRGLASAWTSANPVLGSGEFGLETDTGRVKLGNGSTAWTSLGYFMESAPEVFLQSSQPTMATGDLWLDTSAAV